MNYKVCDSWEEVDVDKIVIKPTSKLKNKSTSSFITSADFDIGDSNDKINVNNQTEGLKSTSSQFRILQRESSSEVVVNPSSSPFDHPKVILEDNTRTQFVTKLRILNRPNRANEQNKDEVQSNVDVQKKLMKSFEEKQAEYAKARLRILGEVMPTEELVFDVTNSIGQVKLDSEKSPNACTMSNYSSTLPASASFESQSLDPTAVNQMTILREPVIPDGTRGFRYVRYKS